MKKLIKQGVSILVSIFLLLQQSLLAGGIVVDKNSPISNQANIDKARNGVPIVNIVKPNENGLSHNKFSKYNVNKEGVILNNARAREVNTQLSGYIYGDENLKNGTAKTILNEVTSKNKTVLRGFTEVAGDRANVVVANPNGIYINGAGFINTKKATITTGKPNIKNGEINSYEVRGGEITIDGDGLNLSNINKAEIYAQIVKLNAQIHAQDLDIVTGENSISKDSIVTNIEDNTLEKKHTISIDSSNFGGIYANKINLIGTQKGVGINLPIEITAQDSFKLSADGKIFLDKVVSQKDISIISNSSDITNNIVYANSVNMEAKESIKNNDTIASQTNINLKAKGIINENLIASGVDEKLQDSSNGNLILTTQELENKKTLYATDTIDIDSTNIKNSNSNIQATKISITGDKLLSDNSIIQANKGITLKAEDITLNNSTIYNLADDINIKAFNNLSMRSANLLTNANAILEATNGTLTFSNSDITTKNNLNLIANKINGNATTSSVLFSGNDLNITSKSDLTNLYNTTLSSANSINLRTRANTISLNNTQIYSNNTISFSGTNLNLDNSKLTTAYNNAQIFLDNINKLTLNNSQILTDNLNFDKENSTTSSVSLAQSTIKSNNKDANITIKANNIIVKDSDISTQGQTTLSSKNIFDIQNATLLANNGLYLNTEQDFVNDANNEFLSDKLIFVSSKSFINNKDFISNGDIFITTTDGNLVNNKLLSSANTTLDVNKDIINNAVLASINLKANSNNLYNNNYLTTTNNMNLNISNNLINKAAIATGNDLVIKSNNLTNYNTIYGYNNINLYTINHLINETNPSYVSNLDYARIYAKNSIFLAKDTNHNYTKDITNKSAIIETESGDINIWADTFTNRRLLDYTDNAFLTLSRVTDRIYFEEGKSYPSKGANGIINNFFITRGQDINLYANNSEFVLLIDLAREPFSFHYATVEVTLDKKIQYDNPLYKASLITSGQDLNMNVKNINNQISTISATKDINLNTDVLTNYFNSIYKTNISFKTFHERNGIESLQKGTLSRGNTILKTTGGKVSGDFDYGTYETTQSIGFGGTILAGGSIKGVAKDLINGTVLENQTIFPTTTIDIATNKTQSQEVIYNDETKDTLDITSKMDNQSNNIDITSIKIPTNEFGMFRRVTNPKAAYLIEANPIYTDISSFIGSSYLLEKLGYRGDRVIKRLGDNAYETKLIRDSVINQTGQRFINSSIDTLITSDYEQYKVLMDNAISVSNDLNLEIGVPLNEEQLAKLNKDIMWMEKVIVDNEEVLVPVLYLAQDYTKTSEAIINAQNEIDLNLSGQFVNSGVVKAKESLALEAKSITNNAGSIISDGFLKLTALNDIKNSSGAIVGSNVFLESLNGNVINETYSNIKTIGSKEYGYEATYTNVGQTGIIEATNGNLVIQAYKDITNTGANLKASNNVALETQTGDINLNAVKLEQSHDIKFSNGFEKAEDISYQTSNINANNIILNSGNNINLEASKLNAIEQINLNAQNDINILALNDVYYRDKQRTKKGTFSKKTTRDMVYKESVNSSELNANDIYMISGNNINLEAVKLNAKNEKIAYAEDSLNILAKTYKEGELKIILGRDNKK